MPSEAIEPQPDADRPAEAAGSFAADSLLIGMLAMGAMTIVQRGVGFFRGIWFCRQMDDAIVGQWSMAYEFIILITPVMLLGMPGSLPRYVEHYRIRGHLPAFVGRIGGTTALLAAAFAGLLMLLPGPLGWLVFLDQHNAPLIHCVGITVLTVVAFNFVHELVTSLRQVRVASWMQFVQSIAFTVIAVISLSLGGGVASLVLSFAGGTLLGIVPGALSLSAGWRGLPQSDQVFDSPSMWRRVMPFAAALCVMNLLNNLFAVADRYMILHLMPSGADPQAAVGQYHSARIFPMLLMSLASMASGVLLPYLAADWESDRRETIGRRLRSFLFALSIGFTAAAALILLVAPSVFAQLLENRYADGLGLMPMALVLAIWISIFMVGENYLWVAERGKLVAAALGIGLIANVGLNLLLLPAWGLHGAVVASMIAGGLVLLALWAAMSRHGYELEQTAFYATILPATLLAGPWIAIGCAIITGLVSSQSQTWCRQAWEIVQRRWKPAPAAA